MIQFILDYAKSRIFSNPAAYFAAHKYVTEQWHYIEFVCSEIDQSNYQSIDKVIVFLVILDPGITRLDP